MNTQNVARLERALLRLLKLLVTLNWSQKTESRSQLICVKAAIIFKNVLLIYAW